MIKAVYLDMDDTLIVNRILYDDARTALCGYLRDFGVTPEETLKRFFEIDLELFKTLGYSRMRMPTSFEGVLKYFVPNADAEMITRVRDMAEKIFTTIADVKPGTVEALKLLKEHVGDIHLVTQGDRGVQEFRVSHLPFKDVFNSINIVESKNKNTYATLAAQMGYNPEDIMMIGDSLKSDILPSIDAGLKAGWIESVNSQHEAGFTFPEHKNAYKFASLLDAARFLVQQAPRTTVTPKILKP